MTSQLTNAPSIHPSSLSSFSKKPSLTSNKFKLIHLKFLRSFPPPPFLSNISLLHRRHRAFNQPTLCLDLYRRLKSDFVEDERTTDVDDVSICRARSRSLFLSQPIKGIKVLTSNFSHTTAISNHAKAIRRVKPESCSKIAREFRLTSLWRQAFILCLNKSYVFE